MAWIVLNIFSVFKFFQKNFLWIYKDEKSKFKNENTERKYSKNMHKNQFLKVKISLLELEKDFKELKVKEAKIKRELEELFFKPIIVSTDEMHIFEQKEMKKIRSIKNTWYDCLINYIPETTKKCRWFQR